MPVLQDKKINPSSKFGVCLKIGILTGYRNNQRTALTQNPVVRNEQMKTREEKLQGRSINVNSPHTSLIFIESKH